MGSSNNPAYLRHRCLRQSQNRLCPPLALLPVSLRNPLLKTGEVLFLNLGVAEGVDLASQLMLVFHLVSMILACAPRTERLASQHFHHCLRGEKSTFLEPPQGRKALEPLDLVAVVVL